MGRLKYNRKILDKLKEYVEDYPDLRFGQILVNSGIIQYEKGVLTDRCIDPFFEEPQITWDRMIKMSINYE